MEDFIKNQTFAIHAVAGAGALTLGTAATYPFETIKTLVQVGSDPDKQWSAAQLFDRVLKLSGNSGLYNGFGWLALGRIFGVGARFGTYELLTAFYKGGLFIYLAYLLMVVKTTMCTSQRLFWQELQQVLWNHSLSLHLSFSQFVHSSDEDIGPLHPLAVSLAAGFSGSIAAAASHSFDTAKCRSQCLVLPKYISMERKFLKWSLPGKRFERFAGIHPRDRNILFRGIWLRMACSGVASFVFIGGYFFVIDHLVSR